MYADILSDTRYLPTTGKMSKPNGIVFVHLSARISIVSRKELVSR